MLLAVVLEKRRSHPVDKNDLLNVMILQKDPKTGESLSDDAIVKNVRYVSSS